MEGYNNELAKGYLLNWLEFYFPGFWHEQSRADRDGYVTIHKGNIMRGMEYNFMKYSLAKINHLGAKYDTCSVMHYGAYAFSRVRRKNAWHLMKRRKHSYFIKIWLFWLTSFLKNPCLTICECLNDSSARASNILRNCYGDAIMHNSWGLLSLEFIQH